MNKASRDIDDLIYRANAETAARFLSESLSRKLRDKKTWLNLGLSLATTFAVTAAVCFIHDRTENRTSPPAAAAGRKPVGHAVPH